MGLDPPPPLNAYVILEQATHGKLCCLIILVCEKSFFNHVSKKKNSLNKFNEEGQGVSAQGYKGRKIEEPHIHFFFGWGASVT